MTDSFESFLRDDEWYQKLNRQLNDENRSQTSKSEVRKKLTTCQRGARERFHSEQKDTLLLKKDGDIERQRNEFVHRKLTKRKLEFAQHQVLSQQADLQNEKSLFDNVKRAELQRYGTDNDSAFDGFLLPPPKQLSFDLFQVKSISNCRFCLNRHRALLSWHADAWCRIVVRQETIYRAQETIYLA